MKNVLKKFVSILLVALIGLSPAYSIEYYSPTGYSVINKHSEVYNASSPAGSFVSYQNVPNRGAVPNECYIPEGYAYTASNITTPQSYNYDVTDTQTYVDNRPLIDRNIDRAGKITGILGVAALFGLGVAAIIHSF